MENVRKQIEPLVLKDVKLPTRTRNFRGEERRPYNAKGERNFSVIIDPEQVDVEDLIAKGWNIRKGKPNPEDPDYEPPYFLRVKVKFFPEGDDRARMNPRVVVVTSNGDMMLDENSIGDLDTDEIMKCNMTISGRWSESDVYTGITAYLRKMAVRLVEDDDMESLCEGLMDE